VPVLEPGAGVVTSRADVHYVVTEHGIAYLHGKTLRERAEALIAIADPRFRAELEDFAVRAHYWSAKERRVVLSERLRKRSSGMKRRATKRGNRTGPVAHRRRGVQGLRAVHRSLPAQGDRDERAAESLRLPHGVVCGRGLHGCGICFMVVPGAGRDHGAAAGERAEVEARAAKPQGAGGAIECASN
jgi:hypothetical protein